MTGRLPLEPITLAEWTAAFEAMGITDDRAQIVPEVDGEDRAAHLRGDFLSESDQDRLAIEREEW